MKERSYLSTDDLLPGDKISAIRDKFGGLYIICGKKIIIDTMSHSEIIYVSLIGAVECKIGKDLSLVLRKIDGGDFSYINPGVKVESIWELESAEEVALLSDPNKTIDKT